ncbi:MAG: cytochrome bc complex cytochrome b subunit, partial [Sulfurimonas sp.]|nr:cytochrome bc complex cytochrome b subunit [Sulfurimonas sp.]
MAHFTKATSVKDWLNQRLAVEKVEKVMASEYWIPKNINFLWAMGMVLAITFALLLVSGIFLLMYYQPDVKDAFYSVNYT